MRPRKCEHRLGLEVWDPRIGESSTGWSEALGLAQHKTEIAHEIRPAFLAFLPSRWI